MDRHQVMNFIYIYLKDKTIIRYGQLCVAFQNQYKMKLSDDIGTELIIRECVWELINLNILVPDKGVSYGKINEITAWELIWDKLQVTGYGQKCIEEQTIFPFDPEGYLKEIQSQIPNLSAVDSDNVILTYLGESIASYNRNCLLAATITLGTASEKTILLLIETFASNITISDPTKKSNFEKGIENRFIYTKYKAFKEIFDEIKKKGILSAQFRKDVDIFLDTMFNFIRLNRNDAGHPTGIEQSKKTVYANLQVFGEYMKRIFELIDYFQNNSITL